MNQQEIYQERLREINAIRCEKHGIISKLKKSIFKISKVKFLSNTEPWPYTILQEKLV